MVQFVRPIVHPMTSAAAHSRGSESSANDELVKAESALSENIGNFFGQNGFVAASGVLLIVGTLKEAGYDVSPELVAAASLPMIVIAAIVSGIHFWRLDHRLARNHADTGGARRPAMSDLGPELLEATYVLIGLLLALAGVRAFLDHTNPRRVTTAAFWLLIGIIFALGSVLPDRVTGVLAPRRRRAVVRPGRDGRYVRRGHHRGTRGPRPSARELAVRPRPVPRRDRGRDRHVGTVRGPVGIPVDLASPRSWPWSSRGP